MRDILRILTVVCIRQKPRRRVKSGGKGIFFMEMLQDAVSVQYGSEARGGLDATLSQKAPEQSTLRVRDIVDGARMWDRLGYARLKRHPPALPTVQDRPVLADY